VQISTPTIIGEEPTSASHATSVTDSIIAIKILFFGKALPAALLQLMMNLGILRLARDQHHRDRPVMTSVDVSTAVIINCVPSDP